MDNSIGLHIYAITQHKTRKPKKIAFSDTGDGSRFLKALPHFVNKYKSAEDDEGVNPGDKMPTETV